MSYIMLEIHGSIRWFDRCNAVVGLLQQLFYPSPTLEFASQSSPFAQTSMYFTIDAPSFDLFSSMAQIRVAAGLLCPSQPTIQLFFLNGLT